jgi:hypothetical protein
VGSSKNVNLNAINSKIIIMYQKSKIVFCAVFRRKLCTKVCFLASVVHSWQEVLARPSKSNPVTGKEIHGRLYNVH